MGKKKNNSPSAPGEDRYRIVSELMSDYAYCFRVCPKGKTQTEWVTDAFQRITGYQAQELDRIGWKTHIHPDDLPMVRRRQSQLLKNKSVTMEFRVRRPDGTICWLRDVARPVWDDSKGKVVRVYGAAHDITERKRVEKAIERAKKEWEQTFDAVPDLIAILSCDFRILRVNRAMGEKLGLSPAQCVGLKCYKVIHGTDDPPEFCPHHLLTKDGKLHTHEGFEKGLGGYYLTSASPLLDAEGTLVGAVHVARERLRCRRWTESCSDESQYHGYGDNLGYFYKLYESIVNSWDRP